MNHDQILIKFVYMLISIERKISIVNEQKRKYRLKAFKFY